MVNERDLGVFVANDLTWSKQVFEQSCRANNLLGYIRRNTRFVIEIVAVAFAAVAVAVSAAVSAAVAFQPDLLTGQF